MMSKTRHTRTPIRSRRTLAALCALTSSVLVLGAGVSSQASAQQPAASPPSISASASTSADTGLAASARAGASVTAATPRAAAGSAPSKRTKRTVTLPPSGGLPDYQLGGAYAPAKRVSIVGRDRSAKPAPGRYTICYINGFQSQPGELKRWPKRTLLTRNGTPMFDPGWPDEVLLDTSTARKRAAIVKIVTPWIKKCARDGFQAVEFDNLDSYTRSHKKLKLSHNLALAKQFNRVAHRVGLAAGQKNTPNASKRLKRDAGFDFAVTESCLRWSECRRYTKVYGAHVINIEYSDEISRARFGRLCASPSAPASTVYRDHDLRPRGTRGHVFARC